MRSLVTVLVAGLVFTSCGPPSVDEPPPGRSPASGRGVRRQALEPGDATYDSTWGTPTCATVSNRCDSAELLVGRGGYGPEPHEPNTVGGSCADGSSSAGSPIAALQRLVVFREDGTAFAAGQEVVVEATVRTSGTAADQSLDLYVAPDANHPSWTKVDTLFPPSQVGTFILTSRYLLPGPGRHVLRGVYRSNGRATAAVPCVLPNFGSNHTDHDDLVITVGESPDPTPPRVALTSPQEGATLERTATVTVEASDNFGVSRVELYDGDILLATATRAPYVLSWATRTASNGPHTLTARAHDVAGHVSTSAPVHVVLDNDLVAPQVSFVSPLDGATVRQTIPLQVQTHDDRGTDRVEFRVGNTVIGLGIAPSFSLDWNTRVASSHGAPGGPAGVSNGAHVLTATAYDAGGNASPPSTVNVVVNNDYTDPTNTLLSPTNGATLSGLVTVEATANDDQGLAEVRFHVDGVVVGIDTTPPYSLTWDSARVFNGSHTLAIQAWDLSGNYASGASILVVTDNAGNVRYDPLLKVPRCDAALASCDSLDILRSRAGGESNSPNTLDGCVDGNWTIHHGRAVNRIRVRREDGTPLAAGKRVRIEVDVWSVYALGESLDLYYTARAVRAATWTHLATLQPLAGGGQTLSAEYVLPAGELQAVRARFGTHGDLSWTVCQENNHTDRDDLVFAVGQEADTQPPDRVVLTAPAEGARVSGTVTVTASASDGFGVVAVDFLDGQTLMGTDTRAPFSVSWDSGKGPSGSHTLTARARDLAGNVTSSLPVTVTVINDLSVPGVALTSPAPEARLLRVVDLSAEASDPEGVIRVEFYADGRLIGSDTSAPFTCHCDTEITATGRTDLTARAYDAAGNVGVSAPVTVTVAVELQPPSVSFTAPTAGAKLGGSVMLSATATDSSGVSEVEFLVDGVLLGSDTTAPHGLSWNTLNVADGPHTLSARAIDAHGNAGTSSVQVMVDNAAPTVALTSPAQGSTLWLSATIQASASDNVGVTQVVFYDGTKVLGTDTSAPYSYNWNLLSVSKGNHTLTARAHDAVGNVTTSAAVTVKVN